MHFKITHPDVKLKKVLCTKTKSSKDMLAALTTWFSVLERMDYTILQPMSWPDYAWKIAVGWRWKCWICVRGKAVTCSSGRKDGLIIWFVLVGLCVCMLSSDSGIDPYNVLLLFVLECVCVCVCVGVSTRTQLPKLHLTKCLKIENIF